MRRLGDLIRELGNFELVNCNPDLEITHLTHDSRTAKAGSLFFAITPAKPTDEKSGITMYALNAVSRGAVVIVTEAVIDDRLPHVIVKNARVAMSQIAKAFYDNACDKMKIVGVTGTNGKTTTTHILYHILKQNRVPVGLIGTLGAKWSTNAQAGGRSPLTTPDPIDLHELFYNMSEDGVEVVIMESSAHAIALDKLVGITFEIGVFTNLSQDHLDFFGDYRTYANTKLNWFNDKIKAAIINADDPESAKINHPNKIEFGLEGVRVELRANGSSWEAKGSEGTDGTWRSRGLFELCQSGSTSSDLRVPQTSQVPSVPSDPCTHSWSVPLAGRFNVYNALAAINCAVELGLRQEQIRKALVSLPPIPGRFNTIKAGETSVIIDYAHTPDSLEKIIRATRELVAAGRIITVFGCGGNRDASKRPLMGRISGKLSDYTIITTDNPRFESPRSIILQIEAGIKTVTDRYEIIEDRADAIQHALGIAKSNDIVIIAGKGAEPYMEIKGVRHPYNDYEVVHTTKSMCNTASPAQTKKHARGKCKR